MSMFNMIAKFAAITLTVAAMGCMTATAQAQSGKRLVVAMAPADVNTAQEAKPMRTPASAMGTPRAKRVATVVAPAVRAEKPDCFWCNRPVYISGLTY
jgi:hypothetical protein